MSVSGFGSDLPPTSLNRIRALPFFRLRSVNRTVLRLCAAGPKGKMWRKRPSPPAFAVGCPIRCHGGDDGAGRFPGIYLRPAPRGPGLRLGAPILNRNGSSMNVVESGAIGPQLGVERSKPTPPGGPIFVILSCSGEPYPLWMSSPPPRPTGRPDSVVRLAPVRFLFAVARFSEKWKAICVLMPPDVSAYL